MRRYTVRFRYIPPEALCAPLYFIPIEEMGIMADSADGARKKFLSGSGISQEDYYIESIEES